jgi:hypothetical protein
MTALERLVAAGKAYRLGDEQTEVELMGALNDYLDQLEDEAQPETAEWFATLGARKEECRRPRHGKHVDEMGGYDSWEWERAPAFRLNLGKVRDYKWAGGIHKIEPAALYRWADRPGYWLVMPAEESLGDPHEVLLPRQPKTRGEVKRLIQSLTPDQEEQ